MPECKSPIWVQYSLSLICILHTLNIKQVTQSETEKIGSYQESTTEECLMYESDNKAVSRHGQGCKHNKTNWIKESQWYTNYEARLHCRYLRSPTYQAGQSACGQLFTAKWKRANKCFILNSTLWISDWTMGISLFT